jgi:HD-GYP domain-containing protein (c-di-GMP phosphodiesterase class II)
MDVGKLKVPDELLNRAGPLNSSEMREMRRHVEHGVTMLQDQPGINDQVLGIVQHHHERHDGSGYPDQLVGAKIPLLARIAGIVDTYDAVTSPRPWAQAKSSNEAVSMLYDLRNETFHGELVEQFIQSIGVYPTGTPVKLSNRQLGVVIAQNPSRRLRPQIMVVQDANEQPLPRPRLMDLMEVDEDAEGRKLSIASAVKPEACRVDLGSLQIGAA